MKIVECEEKGLSFEEVVSEVEKYIEEMNTFFVLENLETLRKNGRLGRVKALVASALKIKPVMGATPEGTICQLDQARGMNKAIVKWWITLERRGSTSRKRQLPSLIATVRKERRCWRRLSVRNCTQQRS